MPLWPAPDDRRLWQRMQRGDTRAFTALYDRHGGVLLRYGLRMGVAQALAEEAVQETFLALLEQAADPSRPGFDPDRGPLLPYLLGVCRNAVLQRLRKTRRESPWTDRGEVSQGADLADVEAVRQAVAHLESPFQEVVVLCDLEGLPYEEAARRLEVPIGTVRSRLARARARLAEALDDGEATGRSQARRPPSQVREAGGAK